MPRGKLPVDPDQLIKLLNSLYDLAVDGVPILKQKSATALGDPHRLSDDHTNQPGRQPHCPDDAARRLVRWQVLKAGTTGFVTGMGGLITMPVGVPANIVGVLFLQLRMIAAIAHLAGYDTRSDQVRTLCYVCLCGDGAAAIFKAAGIKVGAKLAEKAVAAVPGKVLIEINKKVGFRLLTKFGQKGIVNLHKFIPVAGGLVSGGLDASTTYAIGKVARGVFITRS